MSLTKEQEDNIMNGKVCAYCHCEFTEAHEYAVLCTLCFPKDQDDLPIQLHPIKNE